LKDDQPVPSLGHAVTATVGLLEDGEQLVSQGADGFVHFRNVIQRCKIRVVTGFELVAVDPQTGRSIVLLDGGDPRGWNVPAEGSLGLFTALLVIDAERYSDEVVTALAQRLLTGGLAYLCAWGPGCKHVHFLFDLEYVRAGGLDDRNPFLMTTDHADESLAEALWFALDLAISEDVKDVSESAVVIGVDNDEWRGEIRTSLANLTELRRHVVEDIPE
jgi:hypothetical protein